MGTYIARRLILMIPTLLGITFLVFMLVALSPGGIGASLRVAGGQMDASTAAQVQAYLEERYGLDDPAVVQYVRWLGRVTPIKFGRRDLISPTGERIREPRQPKTPAMLDWFAPLAPDVAGEPPAPAAPFAFAPGASAEEKSRIYRQASARYAQIRSNLVRTSTALDAALAGYAQAAGLPNAVTSEGKIRERVLRQAGGPDETNPEWPAVREAGLAALEAFRAAQLGRAEFVAIIRAGPYPTSGIGLGNVIGLDAPDLGVSFSRKRPTSELIADALPVTLMLNLIAFPIIYAVAIPSGMLAAVRRGTWLDVGAGALLIALWSFPLVLAGTLMLGYLASDEYLGWFPVSGLHDKGADAFRFLPSFQDGEFARGYVLDTLWHVCLPVACLVYGGFAVLSKQTRAAMLDNFNADYVRTAKAKGVSSRDIVFRHVFRNSLLPLITMFVTIFPAMLSGSVVIERIFTIPGMGSLAIEAINLRDREVILATTLIIGVVNLLALLLADILYALADPRISYE